MGLEPWAEVEEAGTPVSAEDMGTSDDTKVAGADLELEARGE